MNRALTLVATTFSLLAGCGGGGDDGTTGSTPGDDGVANIEGATFALNIDDLTVPNADEALADIISLFFSGTIVLHTSGQTDSGASVQMGYALSDGSQDDCAPTSDFPDVTFGDDSAFSFGPADTNINTTTTSFVVNDMGGSGTIASDGTSLDDLALYGTVDLRQAVGFAGFDDVESLCDTFANLALDCADCGDGSVSCVDLELAGMVADRGGYEFTTISSSEAAANCPTQ